jgi:Ca2+-binding EF-hand superfamily protein
VSDDLEYAKVLISRYDKSNKNGLNFVEFCQLMEELWDSADFTKEQQCNIAFDKSLNVFEKLFKWLDRDGDLFLEPEDMIYGVSRIMFRDVDMNEIQTVFDKYKIAGKDGKLSKDNFFTALINEELTKTFKDELVTSTFIK